MPASSHRKSPTPHSTSAWRQGDAQLSALASQTDIPPLADLATLSRDLQDRRRLLARRRAHAHVDRSRVLDGQVRAADLAKKPLRQSLEEEDEGNASASSPRKSASASPSGKSEALAEAGTREHRSSIQASSPPPPSAMSGAFVRSSPSRSVTPSGTRIKVNVKRDPDGERQASVVSAAGSAGAGASSSRAADREIATPEVEAEWEEDGPARPGRAHVKKRKRDGPSSAVDHESPDDVSLSDFDSSVPSTSRSPFQTARARPSFRNFHVGTLSHTTATSAPGIKLKLNPTAHTALSKRDASTGASMRGPSGLRGEDVPMTPYQLQQAALWELPRRTPETFLPKTPPKRHVRPYPTKPEDVDMDFSAMDWRERDRERDRLEAAAAAAGSSTGPGPGQAVVKESTAVSRARDRKQDQVAYHVFQQWCDGWFRTLTEEDLAWLSSKSGDLEPLQLPPLGRHYSEVWEEEGASGAPSSTVYLPGQNSTVPAFHVKTNVGSAPNGTARAAPGTQASTFDPRQLRDENLTAPSDDARGGPLTERLLSSILPIPPDQDDDGPSGTPSRPHGTEGGFVALHGHGSGRVGTPQDMASFEDRLANELKAIQVLGKDGKINWSERTDDEVSSTLRAVQRLLRKQMRINEQRKGILFHIAMERMAYQEYLGCLASVDREIESGWLKRQTQIKKSMQAQKKKKGGGSGGGGNVNANTNGASGGPNPTAAAAMAASSGGVAGVSASPAAGTPGSSAMTAQSSSQGHLAGTGGGPIKPQFSETLVAAMERRRQLKFALEPLFAAKPLAKWTPMDSVYTGIDERRDEGDETS